MRPGDTVLKKLFARREPHADTEANPAEVDESGKPRPARKLREAQGLTLPRLGSLAALAVVLVLAGIGYLTWQQLQGQLAGLQQRASTAQGERLAAEMVGRVRGLNEAVEAAAASPTLHAAMLAGDPVALDARAAAVASVIPGALQVRFLPRDANVPDENAMPRLGYAALDLAHQAEQGARPPMELHFYGSPDQHIAVVRAISAPEQPALGVVWANIDAGVLSRWLASAVPPGGYGEVRQGAGGNALLLASHGEMSLQGTSPTASIALPGTAWELVYWLPAGGGAAGADAQWDMLAVFAAGAVALAVVVLVFAWSVQQLLRKDLITLVSYVIDLAQRRRDRGQTVRLRELRKAVEALDEYLRPAVPRDASREAAAPVAPVHPLRTPLEPASVPEDPLFIPEGTIAVEEVSVAEGERKE